MFKVSSSGSFDKTEKFLRRMSKFDVLDILNRYGEIGVSALSVATPVDTGLTASSWSYITEYAFGSYSIIWENSHVVDGVPIAIILQYGHGTGTGGYVQGRDYINPAIQPIFDKIAEDVWNEVTSA